MELDVPEETLNNLIDKVEKQAAEMKKGAKQGAEKVKLPEIGGTEARKSDRYCLC